jgi:hypothetical protein
MLEYDSFLSDGLPIASGVIEGACRHLIKDRLDRTGARWRLKSAEAIIRIGSLRSMEILMLTGNSIGSRSFNVTTPAAMRQSLEAGALPCASFQKICTLSSPQQGDNR